MSEEKVNLSPASFVDGGVLLKKIPIQQFDLAGEIEELLVSKKIVKTRVSLDQLHKHVPLSEQTVDVHLLNNVTKAFYETSPRFRERYFDLIKYIQNNLLTEEFIFQETPTFRFHFPVPLLNEYRDQKGLYLGHHCDSMFGHPFEEINGWVPLTNTEGTNSLLFTSLPDSIRQLKNYSESFSNGLDQYRKNGRVPFFNKMLEDQDFHDDVVSSCRPLHMKYGEIILFDSRCLHAPAENREDLTRVSIDFRMIPLLAYKKMTSTYQSQGRSGRMYTRGDVYFEKSAKEI